MILDTARGTPTGTEILNSGMPAPATGNFCLGVWTKIGSVSFEVNHFALGFDATTGGLTGVANIHEAVNLSTGGNSYTGTFAIDDYDLMGHQLDHIGGNMDGQRVTLNTTIREGTATDLGNRGWWLVAGN